MFRIKSDDQRAKTLKKIDLFLKSLEKVALEKGKPAATWYARMYGREVAQLKNQVERYDQLKRSGVGPFEGRDLREIGAYLVDARIASGLTQMQLAERLDVSQPMVFKYENAEYRGCATEVIERAIKALSLNVDFRLERHRSRKGTSSPNPRSLGRGLLTRLKGERFFQTRIVRKVHAHHH